MSVDLVYPKGRIKQGNLDIYKPIAEVKNEDGSISTVRTMSVNFGEGEVLIPTVHKDGYIMSEDEAISHYKETGEHFGVFETPEDATEYAKKLHDLQAGIIK